jgi:hypothetical protein
MVRAVRDEWVMNGVLSPALSTSVPPIVHLTFLALVVHEAWIEGAARRATFEIVINRYPGPAANAA